MSRWFRFYDDALNDPKVQTLPDALFKTWVNLLCIASRNGGVLGSFYELAYQLRMRRNRLEEHVSSLVELGLLDQTDDSFEPHNWKKRQFKSDLDDPTAAERMQRYRNKHRNGNAHVTVPIVQSTETDTEQKESISRATRSKVDDRGFEDFWAAYPKRSTASPKKPARLKYQAALKRGVTPEAILAGARAYSDEQAREGKIGTPYIKTPEVWLNQEGWDAFAADGPQTGPPLPDDPIARRDAIRKRWKDEEDAKQGTVSENRSVLARGDEMGEGQFAKPARPAVVRPDAGNPERACGVVRLFPQAHRRSAERPECDDRGQN